MFDHREPDPDDKVEVEFYFIPMARCYAAAFFVTLLLSSIATFSAVSWSAETDKIILYYGFLNPCVLFDHYPAKVVAMTGMSCFILIGILYDLMVFFQAYCERRLSATVWTGVVVWTVTLIHLAFVNVFVTNLYEKSALGGGRRRLHGVHRGADGAVSLVEAPVFKEEDTRLTHADVSLIELHTTFYIVWLLGELWFLSLLVQMRQEYIASRPLLAKLGYGFFGLVAVLGMGMHAAAMMVIILQDRPKVDWYFQEVMDNSVQWAVIYLDAKLGTSAWGWVPAMFYRWVFSAGRGVRLTMSLAESLGDDGGLMPKWWVGRALQAISAVFLVGGAFVGRWEADHTTWFRLAAALRSKPFAYYGAPVLLGSFVAAGVGLFFTCAQRRLMHKGNSWVLTSSGMLMLFSLIGCMLIVLDQERFTCLFFLTAVASYSVWVLCLCASDNLLQAIVYCAAGVCLVWAAHATNSWCLYYSFLVWLCYYGPLVPDGPWVYLRMSKLVDDGCEYRPVAGVSVTKQRLQVVQPEAARFFS